MREIKTWRDPYGAGFSTCRPRKIQIEEGLTVLVGCNGAGKTTLLYNIKEELEKEKIPVHMYDNLNDGGHGNIGEILFNEDYAFASAVMNSSEGECISLNFTKMAKGIKGFLDTGRFRKGDRSEKFIESMTKAFGGDVSKDKSNSDERWLLFDATDSGYSIDNVIELKDAFNVIMDAGKNLGLKVYIIISANEYELASGEQCFDVNTGKYLSFKNYDDYKKFILKSRVSKEKRIAAAQAKPKPKRQKQKVWETC